MNDERRPRAARHHSISGAHIIGCAQDGHA
jgi:hypothetical protein